MAALSLRKLWSQIEADLRRAAGLLPSSAEGDRAIIEYREYLDHNELELACDMLETFAEKHPVPDDFWSALADAAEKMKLDDRASYYRGRVGAG